MNLTKRLIPLPDLTLDVIIKFWLHVDKRGSDDCWPWIGTPNKRYGYFFHEKRIYLANRIAYFVHNLKDPGELLVCHTCNNTRCVNPKHFYLGTQQQNVQQSHDENRNGRKGEMSRHARLREFEVLEIRRLANEGVKASALAKQFLVSEATIYNIIARRIWKHI